jgi:sulfide:quinone oxidoreductase
MMPRVVILGAGFGGLAAAYRLRKLARDSVEVTVISDSDKYFYRPSLPYVALGTKSLDAIYVSLPQALSRKGIGFVKGRVQEISLPSSRVETDSGSFKYDYLVVALGSEIAFNEIKGAKEYGYVLCEANCIMELRKAVEEFKGGPVAIILTQNNPFELMDIGFTFTLDHLLRKRGLRSATQIRYFTPNKNLLPHVGERTRNVIVNAFRQKEIETHTEMRLEEVRGGFTTV